MKNQSLSKTKQQALPMSEHEIQNAIIKYLKDRGYYCMRLNSGNKGKFYGQPAGTPDLMVFKPVEFDGKKYQEVNLLFIEVKAPGKKPTAIQIVKMQELEEYSAKCIVAHSVEELEERLKSS